MLTNVLNTLLAQRNGSALVALRMTPLIEIPIGMRLLCFNIVDRWCVEQPGGGLVGSFGNPITAFMAAWRLTP